MNLYNVDILAFYHAEVLVRGIPNSHVQQYYDELPKLVQLPVKGITQRFPVFDCKSGYHPLFADKGTLCVPQKAIL